MPLDICALILEKALIRPGKSLYPTPFSVLRFPTGSGYCGCNRYFIEVGVRFMYALPGSSRIRRFQYLSESGITRGTAHNQRGMRTCGGNTRQKEFEVPAEGWSSQLIPESFVRMILSKSQAAQ